MISSDTEIGEKEKKIKLHVNTNFAPIYLLTFISYNSFSLLCIHNENHFLHNHPQISFLMASMHSIFYFTYSKTISITSGKFLCVQTAYCNGNSKNKLMRTEHWICGFSIILIYIFCWTEINSNAIPISTINTSSLLMFLAQFEIAFVLRPSTVTCNLSCIFEFGKLNTKLKKSYTKGKKLFVENFCKIDLPYKIQTKKYYYFYHCSSVLYTG